MIITTILTIFFAYFLGSMSGAILICKILNLTDPRNQGSQNPGATNIFRIFGYKLAIYVTLFDMLKGAVPIWIGSYLEITPLYLHIITIVVCIGHMYPIFFQFKGGKGVATELGSLAAINIHLFFVMISSWIIIVLIFKHSALGSIISNLIVPTYAWYIQYSHILLIIILSLLILIRHINNIKQLWNPQ
ncbi:putative membrane protein [Candidatus Blochmanniella vafra str. BVAF]|uniref:Glycerol-3-phosphate acyltransferase n=1 Tax=Blochmanniella vafra (strain BVAF) TaxID=859654 RepID=E8Q6N0_BLOVB|nr:glycerol-3-phosphate 1-O-acyltransferase PlsY [Candidatus Blochmannia vafer]ADV33471.1 putative membrane protein [Candidatus Blochmannia vafer str. BVAF]